MLESEQTTPGLALRQAQGEALMLSLSKYEGHCCDVAIH